ncbi:hypothetical protein BGX30_008273, partial [Mortierella sp. GBA39]
APIKSAHDEERRNNGRKRSGGRIDWSREGERTGITREAAKDDAQNTKIRLATLKVYQKARRTEYLEAESERSEAAKV